jgi:ABC-type nitrate/sulfonate/bicarbonate transport system ATPase subunit
MNSSGSVSRGKLDAAGYRERRQLCWQVIHTILCGRKGAEKRRERQERAMELLELVDVPEIANKLPDQTSGGQQPRTVKQ